MRRSPAGILDVDGTLVDTNYHHAIAWYRAFVSHGTTLPIWRIHRHIGMGGDRLVAALAGETFERAVGDSVRAEEERRYGEVIGEVAPLEGSRELLVELKHRGHPVVLASSAKPEEVDHYLGLLDARNLVDGWTSAADVGATKPAPDLVHAALDAVDGGPAVMVGDTTWDAIAAERACLPCIGVLTGGFSEPELREAGATSIFSSIPELLENLDSTPLTPRLIHDPADA